MDECFRSELSSVGMGNSVSCVAHVSDLSVYKWLQSTLGWVTTILALKGLPTSFYI